MGVRHPVADLAVISLMAAGLLGAQPSREATVEQILAALDTYFSTYHEALGQLVAEERMVQRTSGMRSLTIAREIVSDVAFIDLPGDAGWLGFRDTRRVGGRTLPRIGPSLPELLAAGGAATHAQARALLQASARHNLGAPRTTNLPNLPLELLHRRNRSQYEATIEHWDHVKRHDTAIVRLEEVRRPSIIQRPEGGDILTVLRAWIEPGSGRLWRAQVRMVDAGARVGSDFIVGPSTLEVSFVEHQSLGLLVPDRMYEEFYAAERGRGRGEARYSNFRRFSTSARIVPPPG